MKNILLTGGSRGLGLAIARGQLEQGNHLYVVNRSTTNELAGLLDQYKDLLTVIEYDLGGPASIKPQIISEGIGLETPIHAFVNNAATAYDDIVTNLNLETLDQMFRVNVFSPMEITKHVIRSMLLHQIAGSIVHISSICVHTGYKGLAMYAASKGAIEAFSKNTAREWGGKGIRSNCVVAGFMETDMTGSLSEDQKERIFNRTALKQATSVDSVAAAVDYLISDRSQSVTGQNLFVDGGTI